MYPPNLDPSLLTSPLVENLLQRAETVSPTIGTSAAPLPLPGPSAPPAGVPPADDGKLQQAISLIMPMLALGTALGGSARSGGALVRGYQSHQAREEQRRQHEAQLALQRETEARLQGQQARIAQAQGQAVLAQQHAREDQRQRQLASYVLDVNKRAREFTTKDDHDTFVRMADSLAVENYGARPGAVLGAAPFVPVPVRERARTVLDRYRKLAPTGQLATGPLDATGSTTRRTSSDSRTSRTVPLTSAVIQFDVDGDGHDEAIPFARLEELAGAAFFGPDGQRLVSNSTEPVATYGATFAQARGTVFADKPLPTNARGEPDYGKALRDLHALNPAGRGTSAVDRRQARAEAQTQARDRLYTAILNGDSDDAMAQAFSESFRSLGLGYRAEVARIRREINAAGLQGMTPEDRELSTPADIFARGRTVVAGPVVAPTRPTTAPADRAAPGSGGRGRGPVTTARNDYLVARDKARDVLDAEAQRRGLPPGSVTEDQIQTFLANPANRKRIQNMR